MALAKFEAQFEILEVHALHTNGPRPPPARARADPHAACAVQRVEGLGKGAAFSGNVHDGFPLGRPLLFPIVLFEFACPAPGDSVGMSVARAAAGRTYAGAQSLPPRAADGAYQARGDVIAIERGHTEITFSCGGLLVRVVALAQPGAFAAFGERDSVDIVLVCLQRASAQPLLTRVRTVSSPRTSSREPVRENPFARTRSREPVRENPFALALAGGLLFKLF